MGKALRNLPWGAIAGIAEERILAGCSILTGLWSAFINLHGTVFSLPSLGAHTCVGVDPVGAGRSVLTEAKVALVDVSLAVHTLPTRRAVTNVGVDEVPACCSIEAWVRGTFVNVPCTTPPCGEKRIQNNLLLNKKYVNDINQRPISNF